MMGSSTREVYSTTKRIPEDKQKAGVRKKVEVEIIRPKGFDKRLYKPPPLRSEDMEQQIRDNEEALLRDKEDLMDPSIKDMVVQPGQRKDQGKERPFDNVEPLQRDPIPSNQALNKEKNDLIEKVNNGNKERDKVRIPENTIVYKETAKKVRDFRHTSTLSKPGLEEEMAEKIFNMDITIPVGDLMAVSPGIRAVILRKSRNKRVVERAEKAFLQLEANNEDLNPIMLDSVAVAQQAGAELTEAMASLDWLSSGAALANPQPA